MQYTTGTELWNGLYDNRFVVVGPPCSFTDSTSARTTEIISVTEGHLYMFAGGNRCRVLWVDGDGGHVACTDEGNDRTTPAVLEAPVGATGVYFYYNSDSGQTNVTPSVKEAFPYSAAEVSKGIAYAVLSVHAGANISKAVAYAVLGPAVEPDLRRQPVVFVCT